MMPNDHDLLRALAFIDQEWAALTSRHALVLEDVLVSVALSPEKIRALPDHTLKTIVRVAHLALAKAAADLEERTTEQTT